MNVLGNMVQAVRPGGVLLDLQVIRPKPRVEVDGRVLCEIDGEPLFRMADAAAAAVDSAVAAGSLLEEARDDHDVLTHYENGTALVEHFAGKLRRIPAQAVPRLRAVDELCVTRERCRLRRLRALDDEHQPAIERGIDRRH